MAFWVWVLGFGVWGLSLSFRVLGFSGFKFLCFGFWGFASWVSLFRVWVFCFGFWVCGFGFWGLSFGFWVLDFRFEV